MKRIPVTLEIAAVSDVGQHHASNEDNFYVNGCYIDHYKVKAERFETVDTEDVHILAVCDGMGGLKDGDVAAMMGVTTLSEFSDDLIEADSFDRASLITRKMVHEASERIIRRSKRNQKPMGATFSMLTVSANYLYACNIGDSEIYHKSRYSMEQLSKPQTYVQELVDHGAITENQASHSMVRNQLTKYLGMENARMLQPNECSGELFNGDILLICSDGISNTLATHTIYSCLNSNRPVKEIADTIIGKAIRKGCGDDMTVVVARVIDDGRDALLRRRLAVLLAVAVGVVGLFSLLLWLL